LSRKTLAVCKLNSTYLRHFRSRLYRIDYILVVSYRVYYRPYINLTSNKNACTLQSITS